MLPKCQNIAWDHRTKHVNMLCKAFELTANSRWCIPELVLAKSQGQTGLPHTRTSQENHLNSEGRHHSAQHLTVKLDAFFLLWEFFPHWRSSKVTRWTTWATVCFFLIRSNSYCSEVFPVVRVFSCISFTCQKIKVKPKTSLNLSFHFLVQSQLSHKVPPVA